MSVSNFNKNKKILSFLANCTDHELLVNIIENLKPSFLFFLKNIIHNLLKNREIAISDKHKKALEKNKTTLRNILRKKSSKALVKEFKNVQIGGFASILIPVLSAVLPSIISLFKRHK